MYRGGPFIEIFSPQGTDPINRSSILVKGRVRRAFDKDLKGYGLTVDGGPGTKVEFPKPGKNLGLTQRFLGLQICLPSTPEPISIELTLSDSERTRRRLVISSGFRTIIANPLHVQLPLAGGYQSNFDVEDKKDIIIPRGIWMTLCIDLQHMISWNFPGINFRSLENCSISGHCKLRKIFTLKDPPSCLDFERESLNLRNHKPIPRNLQFPPSMPQIPPTLVYNMEEVEHWVELQEIEEGQHRNHNTISTKKFATSSFASPVPRKVHVNHTTGKLSIAKKGNLTKKKTSLSTRTDGSLSARSSFGTARSRVEKSKAEQSRVEVEEEKTSKLNSKTKKVLPAKLRLKKTQEQQEQYPEIEENDNVEDEEVDDNENNDDFSEEEEEEEEYVVKNNNQVSLSDEEGQDEREEDQKDSSDGENDEEVFSDQASLSDTQQEDCALDRKQVLEDGDKLEEDEVFSLGNGSDNDDNFISETENDDHKNQTFCSHATTATTVSHDSTSNLKELLEAEKEALAKMEQQLDKEEESILLNEQDDTEEKTYKSEKTNKNTKTEKLTGDDHDNDNEDDKVEMDLVYDAILDCYFCPKTNKYYKINNKQ